MLEVHNPGTSVDRVKKKRQSEVVGCEYVGAMAKGTEGEATGFIFRIAGGRHSNGRTPLESLNGVARSFPMAKRNYVPAAPRTRISDEAERTRDILPLFDLSRTSPTALAIYHRARTSGVPRDQVKI